MPPAFVNRLRSNSIPLNTIPPKPSSDEYSSELAAIAARILYRSPLDSRSDLPIYILNSAALPNAKREYYDQLLPYVLARLPYEEDLIGGLEYEVVFFAGGNPGSDYGRRERRASKNAGDGDDADEQQRGTIRGSSKPGFAWFTKAYNVLNRATRKRLKKLYIVHEKRWVRILVEMFATIVSPKFRKKVVHVSSLTALALQLPIESLLVPPSAYYTDRKRLHDIYVPYASGKRAFGVVRPFPRSANGQPRLPRVLREATQFILSDPLIKTEGLFRISARQQTVEVLREAYDRGQKFIVWRDDSVLMTTPHHKEGYGEVSIEPSDLEQTEGYDVHTAAALIKLWYKELKEPIFPQASYQALGRFYGSKDTTLDFETLRQMLDPGVEYSVMSPIARQILTTHLLPLLSDVSSHAESNKMTPSNLAVCFGPILLCGPDPIEDFQMSAIIRRILTAMIEKWSEHLAPALGLTNDKLEASLKLPDNPQDREDPLEEEHPKSSGTGLQYGALESQVSGIALLDNDAASSSSSDVPIEADDDSDDSEDESRPPLPPRPKQRSVTDPIPPSVPRIDSSGSTVSIQRKPAPPLQTPPRYSTIITSQSASLARVNGLARQDRGPTGVVEHEEIPVYRNSVATLPPYEEMPSRSRQALDEALSSQLNESGQARNMSVPTTIPRKPVGESKLEKPDGDNG